MTLLTRGIFTVNAISGCLLMISPTTSASRTEIFWPVDITSSGVNAISNDSKHPNCSEEIVFIRKSLGLTWQELADIFQVDRRSLHFWAKGSKVSSENFQRIKDIEQLVYRQGLNKKVDVKRWLYSLQEGRQPIRLLKNGDFDAFSKLTFNLSPVAEEFHLPSVRADSLLQLDSIDQTSVETKRIIKMPGRRSV